MDVYRAPMRARDRDLPPGAGAEFGLANGLVGIGDQLPGTPPTLQEAVLAAHEVHGAKAARMLAGFAAVPDGSLVWTRDAQDAYRLGRIDGPWRYVEHETGIVHVRPTYWLPEPQDPPPAVVATFARGGRNFQRIRDELTERLSAACFPDR